MKLFFRLQRSCVLLIALFFINAIFLNLSAIADCPSTEGLPGQQDDQGGNGYYLYCKSGNVYPGISIRPGDSSINGYSGDAIASFNNGQFYVHTKNGWVNAQKYTPPPSPSSQPPAAQPPVPQSSTYDPSGPEPISSTLCIIVKALEGSIGKAIATIAIVVLGVGLFLGKLSWPFAVAIAVGIGMIFGATEVVQWLSPASSSGC